MSDEINKGGRPRHYTDPAEFDRAVDAYVAQCVADEQPITWTGLALALGFASRSAIDEYAKYDGFLYSVQRAKLIVENAYEKRLHGNAPTGAIFALKNMDWADKQAHEHSGKIDQPVGRVQIEVVGANAPDQGN